MMRCFRVLLPIGAVLALAACGGPSISSLDPALSLASATNEKERVGTRKIGKPYKVGGKWYTPRENENYDEVGMASWYGPGFHGKKTANGEQFNQMAMSAAHTTLPLPSFVRVTNVGNKKSVVVRVNDRGPFSRNRIIDLSKGAAQELGFIHAGHAKVRVEYLGPAPVGGGDKETKIAARKYGTKSKTRIAAATKPKKDEAAKSNSRGFFGFGGQKKSDEKSVEVRLAATTPDAPATDETKPRKNTLPGVRDSGRAAPVRVAGIPGGAVSTGQPKPRGTVSAEPISVNSPAYAAVRADGGTVSAPVKVSPEETGLAYAAGDPNGGAIDALITMKAAPPKPLAEPVPEPSAPAEARFGAHDLFSSADGNSALFRPSSETN